MARRRPARRPCAREAPRPQEHDDRDGEDRQPVQHVQRDEVVGRAVDDQRDALGVAGHALGHEQLGEGEDHVLHLLQQGGQERERDGPLPGSRQRRRDRRQHREHLEDEGVRRVQAEGLVVGREVERADAREVELGQHVRHEQGGQGEEQLLHGRRR
jgi:hypothetical protein